MTLEHHDCEFLQAYWERSLRCGKNYGKYFYFAKVGSFFTRVLRNNFIPL